MNYMGTKEGEKERLLSISEEGKEEGQDLKNTKKTSFRLSTKQGLFIFYSISTSLSIHEEKDKEIYLWEDRGEVGGHSVTLH